MLYQHRLLHLLLCSRTKYSVRQARNHSGVVECDLDGDDLYLLENRTSSSVLFHIDIQILYRILLVAVEWV